MAIYEGSRYTNTDVKYDEEGNLVFEDRKLFNFLPDKCTEYVFCQGDRLDILAERFYKDPNKWWVILEANPIYYLEEEIQVGDTLLIPSIEEVNNLYVE